MKRTLAYTLLFVASVLKLYGQAITVTGVVTSADDNQPLPGVTIIVKGTTVGVTTNIDGQYSIEVPFPQSVLVYSYIGMQPQEIEVAGQAIINAALAPEAYEMEEAVVTALNIRRQTKALGYAQSSFSAEEIGKSKNRSVLNSLQAGWPG
ncbi:MAG: hypothetical protein HC896_17790 [Bacteroidales bacterium]|nr:hypothetical protein [Bacteroidales bacterium]